MTPTNRDQSAGSTDNPRHSLGWKIWQVLSVIQARLRFIAILAVIAALFMFSGLIRARLDKWMRPLLGGETAASPDTEFWCPMHPTIVREKPDKCPICGMPLSKRKKGEHAEDESLPPGVVSRVQLTPWRIAQAGVQTVAIEYQPLMKEISAVGFVEFDERKQARIAARPGPDKSRIEKLYVNVTGQSVKKGEPLALLYNPDLAVAAQTMLDAHRSNSRELEQINRDKLLLWGIEQDQIDEILRTNKATYYLTVRAPIGGHVIRKYQVEGDYVEQGARLYDMADLSTVWIEAQIYEDDVAFMKAGLTVSAAAKAFPDREFKGRLAFVHPHLDASTRTLKVRFDMDNPGHTLRPGMYTTVTLQVPVTQLKLLPADADEPQRRAYERGLVLAVPERAVIDTGTRKIVYRESELDVFDGVEVELGPRTGTFYPVIKGLKAGDRIATVGSFLLDAETRLTGGASSTYFGASAGGPSSERRSGTKSVRPSSARDEEDKVRPALDKLSTEDRPLAEAQGFCPILSDNRLGSMGVPVKVMVKGTPVFLCCKGCVDDALADPQKTLTRVAELKDKVKARPPKTDQPSAPGPTSTDKSANAKVQAGLAKLSPEERRLAEAQGFCPIQDDNRLGSMGKPFKVTLKGQDVFLCCKGCEDDARADPDKTLAKVRTLKEKVKKAAPPK